MLHDSTGQHDTEDFKMGKIVKRIIIAVVVLGVVAIAAAWYLHRGDSNGTVFRTVPVTRGDLLASIGATGTVEPEEVIDVGAQVAGRIVSFGKDANGNSVDYTSPVEPNMVLAQIDDTVYVAQAAEAVAQLQQAKANLQVTQANLVQANAKLDQAQRDWDRAQKLGPSEALAQSSYDSYKSAYDVAKANVTVSDATIKQAEASVVQAEAASQRAQENLDYCTIRSPVKGEIIDRRVNTGQTVVASLNAPSLFLLAKDLHRMQVWVAVNEADIGKILAGQPVTFTVDAFPGEQFVGQVGKVRLNAQMTQNVVTYTVEIVTDNSSGRLLPYLTANVHFELDRHKNVLQVPNAALKWTPSSDQIAPAYGSEQAGPAGGPNAPAGPQAAAKSPNATNGQGGQGSRGVLWVVEGKFVRPIPVQVGLSNDTQTEVQGSGVTEGLEVVTGSQSPSASAGAGDTRNPFAPRFPPRGGRGGQGGSQGPQGGGARG
jgi:HlyD family secretion protein